MADKSVFIKIKNPATVLTVGSNFDFVVYARFLWRTAKKNAPLFDDSSADAKAIL